MAGFSWLTGSRSGRAGRRRPCLRAAVRAVSDAYRGVRARHGRDHGRAEDITQEVFITALRRMRETDREIDFKWIYEIAKNACIDHFRRTRNTSEVSLDPEELEHDPAFLRQSAEIAGHRRLDTTRRYSLPSQADKDAALEAVVVET
jgi:RNA polymerase sigma factor (sigma-70 family)